HAGAEGVDRGVRRKNRVAEHARDAGVERRSAIGAEGDGLSGDGVARWGRVGREVDWVVARRVKTYFGPGAADESSAACCRAAVRPVRGIEVTALRTGFPGGAGHGLVSVLMRPAP